MLHFDVLRDDELDGREIPDAADAGGDQLIGAILRGRVGDGEDAEFEFESRDEFGDVGHGADFDAVACCADECGIGVECDGDGEVLLFKAAVAEKGVSERAHTDEGRIRRVVPSEGAVDGFGQFFGGIAAAGRAGNAGHGKIFSCDNGVDIQLAREDGA